MTWSTSAVLALTVQVVCAYTFPYAPELPSLKNATRVTARLKSHTGSVTVTGGTVGGVDAFLGIPYAKPPIGDLRFSHPSPAIYTANITAIEPPVACLQTNYTLDSGPYSVGEDCLTISVLSPKGAISKKKKLPVMVWIYGGGYYAGSTTIYLSHALAEYAARTDRPVVLAAMQYRLGFFGFPLGKEMADHNATNLGLRDQRLALEWVRDHISSFGGDPKKVMVFGESAGAMSISMHMLNQSMDLFRGAIMESGAHGGLPVARPDEKDFGEKPFQTLLNLTGCGGGGSSNGTGSSTMPVGMSNSTATNTAASNHSAFECLKALPADRLLNASLGTVQTLAGRKIFERLKYVWVPSIDGDLIRDSPYKLVGKGKFARIPFITGSNLDEGSFFVDPVIGPAIGGFKGVIDLYMPKPIDNASFAQIVAKYPNDPSMGSPWGSGNETFGLDPAYKQAVAWAGDSQFEAKRRWFIRNANKHGNHRTWTYRFQGGAPGSLPQLGVPHGSELRYTLGATATSLNYTQDQVTLSEAMMNYWVNFAYYLDPNGKNIHKPHKMHPRWVLNQTYWPAHHYPANKNSINFAPQSVSVIQDHFREDRIAIFNNATLALKLYS